MSKKKKTTESQHYVPQMYLRRFTNKSGQMVCHDKLNDKSYPTTTRAAAQERYFYELPDLPEPKLYVPVNTVEKSLSQLEAAWAPMIAELIESADKGTITAAQLLEFLPFVAMQWLRTKTYRDTATEMIQKSGQSICDDLIKMGSSRNSVGNFTPKRLPKSYESSGKSCFRCSTNLSRRATTTSRTTG